MEILRKFINKVNKEGNATIKVYEPKESYDVLATAIVVNDNMLVWEYVLFNNNTYIRNLLTKDYEISTFNPIKL